MRKIFIILSIFGLLACTDDYLDVDRENVILTDEFFSTPEHALQATNSCYAFLRSWANSAFPAQFVFGVPADDVVKGSNPGDASNINAYDQFTFTSSDSGIREYWDGQWDAVNRCNQVITNVPPIEMNEDLKARYIGEVKFLRAYYYFNLVRIYGAVPIFDGIQQNYNIPRNSKEEVYNFIVSDLTAAASVLPNSYPTQAGRATKGAALGLLSKVYLYMKDYQNAYSTSAQVMGMGYDLDPDFNHLFRVAGEHGVESVFEVDSECTQEFGGTQYAEVQGARGQLGWGFFGPSAALEAAFEPGDKRKELTILRNGETTPEGDVIAMTDDASYPLFNQKVYVPISQQVSGCAQGSVQNMRILRFAEILLINAEAAVHTGNTAQATENLNRVRTRANLGNKTATLENIWHERRVELAMEMDRFVDLVRTEQAASVLSSKGFTANKNEVFPIPQDAISQSNGVLTQNPGY